MSIISKALPIKQIFEKMLNMPYYKNYAAESGAVHNINNHENAITDLLMNNGYKKFFYTQKKLTAEKRKAFIKAIPHGSFIEQPYGTHNAPDFIIITPKGRKIMLEAKSSTSTPYPLFNSGGIKHGYYYVFSCKKYNKTTVFRGEDITTFEQNRLIHEHIEKRRKEDAELNERLKQHDVHNRGVSFYTRPMINQCGGSEKVDYFKHNNREKIEHLVLESLI